MSLLTVPLTTELAKRIDNLVDEGVITNKADFARRALEFYIEDLAVLKVLQAEQEIKEGKGLSGDLDDLLEQV